MRRHRKNQGSEINLTPLLDVLFSILFIIMLTSAQNEKKIESDSQKQVEEMQQQMEALKNQVASYEAYSTDAVVVTMTNFIQANGHALKISSNKENSSETVIRLGIDNVVNIKARIEQTIGEILNTTQNQPIYIVFHRNAGEIYTSEYYAIIEKLNELQENNKEIFFKEMEAETK